ncbi:hypothetical protein PoB_002761400 [Plakobranchus ocellatus]|uniref:Secreted protein n=1 Tax=Plakobranchus ocellatus TaxID=259542 RepID=A0AAV4A4G1_9GAST|nr:hypothetical protein PoB_002761400 [Plakobranchus ocellatus]
MMICRVALAWNTMSGLIPVSWMTLGCLYYSGRSAENSQSHSHPVGSSSEGPCRRHFHTRMNFVPPSHVNTSALALGRTKKAFWVTYCYRKFLSCNTLLCLHVYLPWLRATLQEPKTHSVVCKVGMWDHLSFPTAPDLHTSEGHIQLG